jgi:hypothetical protein
LIQDELCPGRGERINPVQKAKGRCKLMQLKNATGYTPSKGCVSMAKKKKRKEKKRRQEMQILRKEDAPININITITITITTTQNHTT